MVVILVSSPRRSGSLPRPICDLYSVGGSRDSNSNPVFDGLIFISNVDKQPLQTYLNSALEDAERLSKVGQRSLMYARLLVAIVPIAIIYPLLQKYFQKGIVLGSVKG